MTLLHKRGSINEGFGVKAAGVVQEALDGAAQPDHGRRRRGDKVGKGITIISGSERARNMFNSKSAEILLDIIEIYCVEVKR